MRVLAVDSAGDACSVALAEPGVTLAAASRRLKTGHAEVLVPLAIDVLQQAGCGFADIDAFAVTTGPGGFTGIRIGIAAVAGMALAHDRPILGIDSFTASLAGIAEPAAPARWLVALDSRRGDVFCQMMTADLAPLTEPAILAPAAVDGWLATDEPLGLTGNAAGVVATALGEARFCRIVEMAAVDAPRLAALALARVDRAARVVPAPLYLSPPAATLPSKP